MKKHESELSIVEDFVDAKVLSHFVKLKEKMALIKDSIDSRFNRELKIFGMQIESIEKRANSALKHFEEWRATGASLEYNGYVDKLKKATDNFRAQEHLANIALSKLHEAEYTLTGLKRRVKFLEVKIDEVKAENKEFQKLLKAKEKHTHVERDPGPSSGLKVRDFVNQYDGFDELTEEEAIELGRRQ